MGAYIPYYGAEFVLDVIASLGLVLFDGLEAVSYTHLTLPTIYSV